MDKRPHPVQRSRATGGWTEWPAVAALRRLARSPAVNTMRRWARRAEPAVDTALVPYRFIGRRLAAAMPKGLYARSLIIIITPIVILQSVVAFVFMERHWQTVTQRLSAATVRDIAAIVEMIDTYPADAEFKQIKRRWQDRVGRTQ